VVGVEDFIWRLNVSTFVAFPDCSKPNHLCHKMKCNSGGAAAPENSGTIRDLQFVAGRAAKTSPQKTQLRAVSPRERRLLSCRTVAVDSVGIKSRKRVAVVSLLSSRAPPRSKKSARGRWIAAASIAGISDRHVVTCHTILRAPVQPALRRARLQLCRRLAAILPTRDKGARTPAIAPGQCSPI
jgi:hypothetical protein